MGSHAMGLPWHRDISGLFLPFSMLSHILERTKLIRALKLFCGSFIRSLTFDFPLSMMVTLLSKRLGNDCIWAKSFQSGKAAENTMEPALWWMHGEGLEWEHQGEIWLSLTQLRGPWAMEHPHEQLWALTARSTSVEVTSPVGVEQGHMGDFPQESLLQLGDASSVTAQPKQTWFLVRCSENRHPKRQCNIPHKKSESCSCLSMHPLAAWPNEVPNQTWHQVRQQVYAARMTSSHSVSNDAAASLKSQPN